MRFFILPAIAVVALTTAGCSSDEATTGAPTNSVAPTTAATSTASTRGTTTTTAGPTTTTAGPTTTTAGPTTTTAGPTTTTAGPTSTLYPTYQPGLIDQCPAPRGLGDRRSSTKTLTIMHWNVEWLFRGNMVYEGRPYPQVSCPGSCGWGTTAIAQTHLEEVSKFISSVKADIVSLNEVQDCTVMDAVSRDISDGHAPYLTWSKDTYTGQNVGLISKIDPDTELERMDERVTYPIPGSQCGFTGASKTRAPTKNFITTFNNIEGLSKPLTFIGAHLLARPVDKERCSKREAEATVIANRTMHALTNGHHVVVIGDLNDFDRLNPDHDNSMPTSTVLEILRLNGKMRSATEKLPQEKRFTYDSEKYGKNSLDHFLMDAELYNLISSVEIRHDSNDDTVRSDHHPIVVMFDLTKSSKFMA